MLRGIMRLAPFWKHTLPTALGAAALAFFAGRWSVSSAPSATQPAARPTSPALPATVRSTPAPASEESAAARRVLATGGNLTVAQARLLTTEEKLEAVRVGALIFEGGRQTDYLLGVLQALDKDELKAAVALLGTAQGRGNFCAQSVWDTVWTQWGRVDARGILAELAVKTGGKSRTDARHIMQGWLETDPAAARAWALEPKTGTLDAAAAASLFTAEAGGDPQKLQATLLTLPAGSTVVRDALQDYFDLASLGGHDTPAAYDQLDPALRPAAWSAAMERLTYTDPQAAVDWLVKHVNDPGRDYSRTFRLVQELAREDPEETTQWALQLPAADGEISPAQLSFDIWRQRNPTAAASWLRAQPPGPAWLEAARQTAAQSQ